MNKYDVFISYRRKGGSEKAQLIKSELKARGISDKRLFLDTHSLYDGDFEKKIREAIGQTKCVVVVISNGCFDEIKEKDYWLLEIKEALSQGKQIIPILFDDIKDFDNLNIPSELSKMRKMNSITYEHQYADAAFDRLFSFIDSSKENAPIQQGCIFNLKNRGCMISFIFACLILISMTFFNLPIFFDKHPEEVDIPLYRQAVVYIRTIYHPIITFKDNPMQNSWNGELSLYDLQLCSQSTAFFLDYSGRLGTSRAAIMPWKEMSKEVQDTIRNYIKENLPNGNTLAAINDFFQSSVLGNVVMNYAVHESGNNQELLVKNVLDITSRIANSSIEISGVVDYIAVGYPGIFYNHADDFPRCNVLKVSDDENVDLAILQLNNKTTPKNIKNIFNPDDFYCDRLEPMKDQLYVIGYHPDKIWFLDENTKSLEPNIRETRCTKEPSKYNHEIMFQSNYLGGSSGSPVFNSQGQLVGIISGGNSDYGLTIKAILSKYLKKMYEEEINL